MMAKWLKRKKSDGFFTVMKLFHSGGISQNQRITECFGLKGTLNGVNGVSPGAVTGEGPSVGGFYLRSVRQYSQ